VGGLVGIAFAVARTVADTDEHVMPSVGTLVVSGVLAIVTISSSGRAWVALFSDLVDSKAKRTALRGTLYLSQLTKYLPAGGVVQAASQVGLARSLGIPLRRVAVAYPVSVVAAVAAGGTLGSGLVFDTELDGWIRALSLLGLATVVFLHRGLMAWVLELGRRVIHRIPDADQLPTQRDILSFYGWALLTIGPMCAAYALMLGSVATGTNPFVVFCAFAVSWVVGFLAVPIPAGVGVREAVLVALIPGVGTAPLLAVSLALRLLSIGAEVVAFGVNRVVSRRQGAPEITAAPDEEPSFP
jgi:hypothetical protein